MAACWQALLPPQQKDNSILDGAMDYDIDITLTTLRLILRTAIESLESIAYNCYTWSAFAQ